MSQHVSGHIGQSVSNEYGYFITIGGTRIRKSLIMAYAHGEAVDEKTNTLAYFVVVLIQGSWIKTKVQPLDDVTKEIEQLDWIFKKDYSE